MDFLDDDLFSDDEVFHFFIDDWDDEAERDSSCSAPQELDSSLTFWDLIAAKLDPTGADGLRQRIHDDLKSRPQQITPRSTLMIIGNALILTPPGCKTSVIVPTLASGNTCGAIFWTDTKCEAPMLPDQPSLYKHPIEGTLFWIDDCEKSGTLPPGRYTEPDFPRKGLNPAAKPTADDYFAALESGIADTDKRMLEIRTRLWWLGNDPVREGRSSEPEPRFLENLTQLVLFYSGQDTDSQIVKAELLRELGYFKDSLSVLENQDFGDLHHEASFIASLCQKQDARVAKLP